MPFVVKISLHSVPICCSDEDMLAISVSLSCELPFDSFALSCFAKLCAEALQTEVEIIAVSALKPEVHNRRLAAAVATYIHMHRV